MTKQLLFYTHEDCLAHEMQPRHPERPDRLRAVYAALAASGLSLQHRTAPPVAQTRLADVHTADLLARLNALRPQSGLAFVDADTAMNPKSLDAAASAAGAVVEAVSEVLSGTQGRAFCAVRPPGHHAEAATAMGFCLHNSIAMGAMRALREVDRLAVLDFDVHHGNGTVDIFKDRPQVLVCSSFQHPHYPYRYADIRRPNIINTPLPAGAAGPQFRQALERDWIPAVKAHRPDLILVSAGFDAHRADPLASLMLEDADFRWVTELIIDLAQDSAQGRIVSALEGGYDLDALGRCAALHAAALAGHGSPQALP